MSRPPASYVSGMIAWNESYVQTPYSAARWQSSAEEMAVEAMEIDSQGKADS